MCNIAMCTVHAIAGKECGSTLLSRPESACQPHPWGSAIKPGLKKRSQVEDPI